MIDEVIDISCEIAQLKKEIFLSPCRKREYVFLREIVANILCIRFRLSTILVGKGINRDHSTITALLKSYNVDYRYDKEFKSLSDRIWDEVRKNIKSENMHECKIGIIKEDNGYQTVTWKELIEKKKEEKGKPLEEYADLRYNVGLERFTFCPICGKEIDWKQLKEEAKNWQDK